jgi:hypothetical protein
VILEFVVSMNLIRWIKMLKPFFKKQWNNKQYQLQKQV